MRGRECVCDTDLEFAVLEEGNDEPEKITTEVESLEFADEEMVLHRVEGLSNIQEHTDNVFTPDETEADPVV